MVNDFTINIVGLSDKKHHYRFVLGDSFFESHGRQIIETGKFNVDLELDKHATFISSHFKITGHAHLTCDRTLEPFEQPLSVDRKIIFKYGDENKEVSEDIVVIARDTDQLDVGQYLYEFVCLEIPIKKIHPRFRKSEETAGEGALVYSSAPPDRHDDDLVIDPRWEKLKSLT